VGDQRRRRAGGSLGAVGHGYRFTTNWGTMPMTGSPR
jgi:hypothetical protein